MEEESWVISTLSRALAFSTPLLWGALGEVYAERAGVINLGIEGMMLFGALSAFAGAYTTGSPGLGLLLAAAVGSLMALVHAFVAITLRANQYVAGLALSMLGSGLAGLLGRGWVGVPLPTPLPNVSLPVLSTLPFFGPAMFTAQSPVTYLGLLLAVVLWFGLFYTRWGMVIRSTGESPVTADTLGVSVALVRYLAVAFGGALAGVAGGFLSVAYRPAWTEGMTAGMGWIALAIVILAAWDPLRALAGALLFGALYHLAFRLQAWVAPELLRILPYICTIVALTLTRLSPARRWQGAPAALGLAYVRGERQ